MELARQTSLNLLARRSLYARSGVPPYARGTVRRHRVGFFLRVDDFDAAYLRMTEAGVTFVREPRTEPYGRVAVFLDIAGNRWDLLGAT